MAKNKQHYATKDPIRASLQILLRLIIWRKNYERQKKNTFYFFTWKLYFHIYYTSGAESKRHLLK